MTDTVMQTLKKAFWHVVADATYADFQNAFVNDTIFLLNVKNGRDAMLHFQRKHLPLLTKKVVNQMLSNQQYTVSSMKYHIYGMDVFF